jgi:shikimate kinase|tara:strand:+ start:99 stop:620 length:522 start_codon:yes stop_codon:yes gene_type:complete
LIKNLVLTGMMGVGKSTIGRSLASKLSYRFIDIDELIENKEGSSINLIFKKKGENYFRRVENEITLDQLKKRNVIISLGGGAFMNRNIRREAKKNSLSFWLDLSTDEIVKRLKKSNKRPLLFNKNLIETINKIYLDRRRTYNEASFRIRCNSLKSEEIVNKILLFYEKSRNKI